MAEIEMQMEKPVKKPTMVPQIILYVVLAAIVFGAGGYYLGTKQPKATNTVTASVTPISVVSKTTTAVASTTAMTDATADWKTYTNDPYGFSFKYPSDWTLSESTSYPGASLAVGLDTPSRKEINKCHESGCDSPNSMSVRYYNSISDKDAEGGYSSLINYLKVNSGTDKRYTSYEDIKIGSQSGYKALAGKNTFGGGTYYYIEKANGSIVEIWMFDGDKEVTPAIDSQILSTFQFTK